MKSVISMLLCLLALTNLSAAFQSPLPRSMVSQQSNTALNVFGNKKSAAQRAKEEEAASKYWQGEWVCKDCGYIYNRVRALSLVTHNLFVENS